MNDIARCLNANKVIQHVVLFISSGKQQMLFCVAMVRRLSSNCIREVPQSANCSCVSRLASQFTMTVMGAGSSQAFMASPSAPYYAVVYAIGNAAKNTHRVYT